MEWNRKTIMLWCPLAHQFHLIHRQNQPIHCWIRTKTCPQDALLFRRHAGLSSWYFFIGRLFASLEIRCVLLSYQTYIRHRYVSISTYRNSYLHSTFLLDSNNTAHFVAYYCWASYWLALFWDWKWSFKSVQQCRITFLQPAVFDVYCNDANSPYL